MYEKRLADARPRPLYWGYYRNNNVEREEHSIWREADYPTCDGFYVPYALGGGYVLTMDLVRFLAQLSADGARAHMYMWE